MILESVRESHENNLAIQRIELSDSAREIQDAGLVPAKVTVSLQVRFDLTSYRLSDKPSLRGSTPHAEVAKEIGRMKKTEE